MTTGSLYELNLIKLGNVRSVARQFATAGNGNMADNMADAVAMATTENNTQGNNNNNDNQNPITNCKTETTNKDTLLIIDCLDR